MTSGFTRLRISRVATLFTWMMLTIAGHAWPTSAIYQETARVAGTVSDPLGSVVVNAKVSIKGSSFERETATNWKGQYEIEAPSGIYSIEVWSPGFCRARRASFRAGPNNEINFDFTLRACPSHGDGPMRYESFVLKTPSEPPDFLIQFGKRTDRQDTIEFEGVLSEIASYDLDTKITERRQNYAAVVVTYDGWTISAKHLTLKKRTLQLELSGDVSIIEGVRETKAQRAEVDFAVAKPILSVTQ